MNFLLMRVMVNQKTKSKIEMTKGLSTYDIIFVFAIYRFFEGNVSIYLLESFLRDSGLRPWEYFHHFLF